MQLTYSAEKDILPLEKQNPGLRTQGFQIGERPPRVSCDIPTLAYPPPVSNEKEFVCETAMTYYTGQISLPRSVIFDDNLIHIPGTYWRVLLVVCSLCRYTEGTYNDNGEIIVLKVGQCCISEEELTAACGRKFTRKVIRGAINEFIKSKIWAKSRAKQKTVLTITRPDLYDALFYEQGQVKGQARARSGPIKEQSKQRKQEEKEKDKKEKAASLVVSADAERLVSLFFSDLIGRNPAATPPSNLAPSHKAMQQLIGKHGLQLVEKVVSSLPICWYAKNVNSVLSLKEKFVATAGYVTDMGGLKPAMSAAKSNRELAEAYAKANKANKTDRVQVENQAVLIVSGNFPWTLEYTANGFAQQLENRARKCNLIIPNS